MRLVTIDNGNTHKRVGFFTGGVLTDVVSFDQYTPLADDYILISSVGQPLSLKPSFDLKSKRTKTHFFDMKIQYSETLGEDRMIGAYGVFKKLKGDEKALVIDAGTFITCDLVTPDGFQGGYILPGLNRFLKIYGESANLPTLAEGKLFHGNTGLPHSTEEAILGATEIYLKSSLEEIIRLTAPDKVVFTGGSADVVKNLISSKVRFESDRHLIHLALSLIHQVHLRQE